MANDYNRVVHYGLTTLPPLLLTNIVNTLLDAIAVLSDDMALDYNTNDTELAELDFD